MVRSQKEGVCIYCLNECSHLTSDHVIPRSWYPDTAPENKEKWQVPCCIGCNNRFSQIEKRLLKRFAVCMHPEDPSTVGVRETGLRSIDPAVARSALDQRAREAERRRLLAELTQIGQEEASHLLPSSTLPNPNQQKLLLGVRIGDQDLNTIAEKMVRGVTFRNRGSLINGPNDITTALVAMGKNLTFIQMVTRFGQIHSWGPGVEITYAPCNQNPTSGLIRIRLWGTLLDISAAVL